MNMELSKTAINLLGTVFAASSQSDEGYHLATEKQMMPLIKTGLVQLNRTISEGDKIAFRTTEAGNAKYQELQANGGNAPSGASSMDFEIEDNIPLPEKAKTGRKSSTYPFEKLNVGQSFFIAATDEHPEPWKRYASTVSSATARYDVETGETETITRKKARRNEHGEIIRDANNRILYELDPSGKPIMETVTRPKTKHTRVFVIRRVEENRPDPNNPGQTVKRIGARVWRES